MRLSILVLVALAAPAAAQPALTQPEPPAVEERREWYGYWTLAADLGAYAAGASGESLTLGLAAYAAGGPLVHVAKGNYQSAGLSLAARTVIPLGLAWWGSQSDEREARADPDDKGGSGANAAAGAILGIALASVIDAVVRARRTVTVPREPAWSLHVAASHGVVVGVGGSW